MQKKSLLFCALSACLLVASSPIGSADVSQDSLPEPFVEHKQWEGFLSCAVHAVAAGLNPCWLADTFTPGSMGEDSIHVWGTQQHIQSVVGAMVWEPGEVNTEDALMIVMELAGMPNEDPVFVRDSGESPLEWRVDISRLGQSIDFQYRVFAGGEANVVVHQPFKVYWDLYYVEPAPPGASALPQ